MAQEVAYNPNDTWQQRFLSALSLGESGGNYNVGTGGTDLSGTATDQYGFPIWGGTITAQGPSHAAGAFQFQPGTWAQIASAHGLNFQNAADQNAGAWYLAEDQYSKFTGGGSLEDALSSGNFMTIQQALAGTWTSVTGNAANPQGLAASIAGGVGAVLAPGSTATASGNTPGLLSDPVGALSSYFTRGAMIFVGALILLVAIWELANKTDVLKGVR